MSDRGVMTPNRATERRTRRSLRIVPMVVLSVLVLSVGWSILWLYAHHEARQGFDTWLAAERQQGRIWTCPDRHIGGYPLGIAIRCTQPTFADDRADGVRGTIAALTAEAQLYFPTNVRVTFEGPLQLRRRGADLVADVAWSAAHLTLRGDVPGDLDRGQLEADNVSISPAGIATPTRIGHVELGFRPLDTTSSGVRDAEAVLRIAAAASPDADAAFGSTDPIDAATRLIVTKLPNATPSLPVLLEAWRIAGGNVTLKSFSFGKGTFSATGDGYAEIDDDHRLAGRLEARFAGLEPVAARFGIPLGAVKIGGLLAGLLGGKAARPDAGATELALPLVAHDGRLSVGPVRTGVALPPLY